MDKGYQLDNESELHAFTNIIMETMKDEPVLSFEELRDKHDVVHKFYKPEKRAEVILKFVLDSIEGALNGNHIYFERESKDKLIFTFMVKSSLCGLCINPTTLHVVFMSLPYCIPGQGTKLDFHLARMNSSIKLMRAILRLT